MKIIKDNRKKIYNVPLEKEKPQRQQFNNKNENENEQQHRRLRLSTNVKDHRPIDLFASISLCSIS